MKTNNIFPFEINQSNAYNKVLWIYGLSGSGKSTLAKGLAQTLKQKDVSVYILDGDNLRDGLNSDLGFSDKDRYENLRRSAEVAKLIRQTVDVVICTFISPLANARHMIKQTIGKDHYIDVYLSTPLDTCEKRDPKGLYKKARSGEIRGFTGIDAPFEKPACPRLSIDTSLQSIEETTKTVMQYLGQHIT